MRPTASAWLHRRFTTPFRSARPIGLLRSLYRVCTEFSIGIFQSRCDDPENSIARLFVCFFFWAENRISPYDAVGNVCIHLHCVGHVLPACSRPGFARVGHWHQHSRAPFLLILRAKKRVAAVVVGQILIETSRNLVK